jgi:chromodomain-helicase-DNA-binding protein 1
MARAHRIGQQNHVNVYRLVTKDTVEEDVLERARKKMILEHAIISQVDTSGLNIGRRQKNSTAKENYSKEELSQILKYGASNIFKSETTQEQLEEMDLDDVLKKAENYETENAPGGTSLGGDEFLRIAVQDVKADLTSWDDIIPVADRELAIIEKAQADAAAEVDRKSKIKSLAATSMHAALEDSGEDEEELKQRKKGGPPAGKTKAQRSLELSEKDIRLLVRAIQRFGDVRYRYDKVVQDAKLDKKNRTVILQHAEDIIKACKTALAENEAELDARVAKGEEVNRKLQKAILVTHNGASSINAETTLSRNRNLKILNDGKSWTPRC